MAERKLINQPPYTFEASIKASSPNTKTNIEFLNHAKLLIDSKRCLIIGPIPAMQSKVRGSYQHHLVLQAPARSTLNSVLVDLTDKLSQNKISKKVRWSINVDPIEF
jgi:primosomal protein N' (replication factor Y)